MLWKKTFLMQDRIFTLQKSFKIEDYHLNKTERTLTGIFSVADVVDTDGDTFLKSALCNLLEYQKGDCIQANIEHNPRKVFGFTKGKNWHADGNEQLGIEGVINLNPDETGDEAIDCVTKGEKGFLSIEGKGSQARTFRKGMQRVTEYGKVVFTGIALVANPANKGAKIRSLRKSENIYDEIENKLQWKEYIADELIKNAKDEYLNDLWKIACNVNDEETFQVIMKSQGFNIENELVYDLHKTAQKIKQNKIEAQASNQPTAQAVNNNFSFDESLAKKLIETASIFNNK